MKIPFSYMAFLGLGIFIALVACIEQNAGPYLKTVIFDPESRILSIDPDKQQDTVFQQVIHFSGIRHKGYGLILNMDQAMTKEQVDSIKLKLQKLDINAIHDFKIFDTVSPPMNVVVAIENAKFCWILADSKNGNEMAFLNPDFISALKQSAINGGIIVADQTYSAKLKQLLINQ
ncbi:MAG: hypothetical protein JW731_04430 [Bacteroidales bacterium]|nr:hypothetical protein [Bacteroidales bacterium]